MPLSIQSLALCAAVWLAGAALQPAFASEREFSEAIAAHRRGDMSGAYGRFLVLAGEGDPDAARIVLFMQRYGPQLYGAAWDAPQDVEDLLQVASFQMGRPPPDFVPLAVARSTKSRRGVWHAVKRPRKDER